MGAMQLERYICAPLSFPTILLYMLKKRDIIDTFISIGVSPGDVLVLQSSFKGCGEVENGPEGVIDALMELLGPEGTLIMPSYNFKSWTEEHYFDILETPSGMGIITELFRRRKDVGRTNHPIHSMSVWGKLKDELESLRYNSSFGPDSIFNRLLDYNALYCTIGLGSKMPFLPCHYSEVLANVPYRRIKHFGGIYVDKNRNAKIEVYNFHVRINKKDPVYQGHIYLIENGKVYCETHNGVRLCYARAKNYHKGFTDYIKEYPKFFGSNTAEELNG